MLNIGSISTTPRGNGMSKEKTVQFSKPPGLESNSSYSTLLKLKTTKKKHRTTKTDRPDSDITGLDLRMADISRSNLGKRKFREEKGDVHFKPLPDVFRRSGKFIFREGSCYERNFSIHEQTSLKEIKNSFAFGNKPGSTKIASFKPSNAKPKTSKETQQPLESKVEEPRPDLALTKKPETDDLIPRLARLNVSRIPTPIRIIDDLSTSFSSIDIQNESDKAPLPDQNRGNSICLISESELCRHVKRGDMWKHWLTLKESRK